MKKLLSILGTITIAGSGTAGLVGNAPHSAKNEINSLETNNLENLNREKRQNYNTQLGGYEINNRLNTGIWSTSGNKLRANASKEKILERFKTLNQHLPLNLNLEIFDKQNNYAKIGIKKDFGQRGYKDTSSIYW